MCDNGDRVWGTPKVLTPFNKGEDDGKEFLVIAVIVSFCRREHLGEICVRVKITIDFRLHEHCTCCKKRSVCIVKGQETWGIWSIGAEENMCLRVSKAFCWSWVQIQGEFILSGQKVERRNNGGEVRFQLLVEISQTVKDHMVLTEVGELLDWMVLSFFGSISTLLWLIIIPKNSSWGFRKCIWKFWVGGHSEFWTFMMKGEVTTVMDAEIVHTNL